MPHKRSQVVEVLQGTRIGLGVQSPSSDDATARSILEVAANALKRGRRANSLYDANDLEESVLLPPPVVLRLGARRRRAGTTTSRAGRNSKWREWAPYD